MFASDSDALAVINTNFRCSRGGILFPKESGYVPTEREQNAIDYLIMEWDYGYGM